MKKLVKNIFSVLGFEIRRKIHAPLNNPFLYNSKESTDKFYADEKLVAEYENEARISFYRDIVDELSLALDFGKINTVADVSAGTGRLLAEFREKFPGKKFCGFEYSDKALELCKKNCPEINFEEIDLAQNSHENLKFDLLLCVDTLEHFENPESVLHNLLQMLNENGNLCLVVPNGRYDTFEGHIHYWSPESFRLFLEKNNCVILYTKVWNKYNEQLAIVHY